MSMNSFRTHTQPPPRLWCDICDEHGTMILAEFPVLYNYQDYRFTPEEYEIWHRNVVTDVAGWMARLWNHPSVIMWVLSNESQGDNAWEEGPYQDFVNALDPTRPTLRTGTTGTKENYDVHTCGNITEYRGRESARWDRGLVPRGRRPHDNQHGVHELLRPPEDAMGRSRR